MVFRRWGRKPSSQWAFVTNHALVLAYIARHKRITALELASEIGITERATRKIIADLLEEGYIIKEREGRRNRYDIVPDQPLRNPINGEAEVGALLRVLGWRGRKKQQA
ncbi:MAG: winged helix-turn-helix transcriptional regulator [Chloroflexi bacterium]|nr:winged helix-turn-helix transcriptional regulator [Chloroflexota bacterium]MBM3153909.1 winged helix-turn-helix transcriptional regulator [Chloroflexota bacterium]MBM3172145.1 winged helix-turn-helix transcriptional regulator [Chloroflexota bacterium]MBM3175361.1 winged helix-turn-helix transcriptional regulator [Chloroflexota bacterium]MBM4450270.1 winged helix-turn-helix transcriptional regulator [Chloroflexota bacterium]